MAKILLHLVVVTTVLCLSCETVAQSDIALATRKAELKALSENLKKRDENSRREAQDFAGRLGIPVRRELPNGKVLELQRIAPGIGPVFYITNNTDAADTVSTDEVWPGGSAGLNLDGGGMTVGEWDGGAIYAEHPDFTGRLTQVDGATEVSNHSTHVAGTLIGSGDWLVPDSRGMAYAAHLDAYDWNSDTAEMALAASNGLLTSNHSYGIAAGWLYLGDVPPDTWWWIGGENPSDVEDPNFGYYDSETALWDQIAFDAPYYLIVKAAGNDRTDIGPAPGEEYTVIDQDGNFLFTSTLPRQADCAPAGYDCMPGSSVAKNILTVGAVDDVIGGYSIFSGPSSVQMAVFSGWGPTDDGRIKPDIVGNGMFLMSAFADYPHYAAAAGTSMSAPNVTGSLLLLQEHYQDINGAGNFMRAATLKALAIHTADEAGDSDGPDYEFGWGLLNTKSAAQVITEDGGAHRIIESSLSNSAVDSVEITVTDSDVIITATLVWADPPATPVAPSLDPPDIMLVNDLDLRVINGPSTHMPWVLNPASPADAATRGDNIRDNVEQVVIEGAGTGSYFFEVSHKGTLLNGENQDYSLIISVTPTPPSGSGFLIDEDFSGGLPAGWSIDTIMGIPWTINSPVPGGSRLDNNTGGSGNFAMVDNNYVNQTVTSLRTPSFDLSSAEAVVLRFKSQYVYDTFESLNVDISTDGGTGWGNAWTFQGFNPFPTQYVLDLTGQTAGYANVNFRFRFDSMGWLSGDYWQIDDIELEVFGGVPTPADPPGQASSPSPAPDAGDVGVESDLNWAAGSGATSHDVYFGDTIPLNPQGNQAATSFDPGSLNYETTYYWRIDEVNGDGTTPGNTWSFTTEAEPVLPGPAGNPSPGDGATGVNVGDDLSWTAGADADSHDVYIDDVFQGNQAVTTFDPGTLAHSTAYSWRIDEVNGDGTTTGSTWSFTTEAAPVMPGPASNPGPSDGATGVNVDDDLVWTAGSDTISHDVYFNGAFQGNQANTTFDLGTLAYSTAYNWRIDEVNANGTTTGSTWSFTTEAEPVSPPGPASSPGPADGASGVGVEADLDWTAGSGTTSHNIYFGTASPPPSLGSQTGTVYDPGTLNHGTTYYWRIDEVNSGGITTGPVWSFTTELAPALPAFRIVDISITTVPVKGPRNSGVATVTVAHDEGGASPLSGFDVSGTFSDDWSGTRSSTTDISGEAVMETPAVKNGTTWQFCVDTASKTGWDFDEAGSASWLCGGGSSPVGSISGVVSEAGTGLPIQGASVSADTGQSDSTDAGGNYTLSNVPSGTRTVSVSAGGHDPDAQQTTVSDGGVSTLNFALTPTTTGGTGTLKGTVMDISGARLSDVTVQVLGGPSATTNKRGKYTIQSVPEGVRTVTASKAGFEDFEEQATIMAGSTTTFDIDMTPGG